MGAINCFAMAAINVPFIVANPSGAVWNWASLSGVENVRSNDLLCNMT